MARSDEPAFYARDTAPNEVYAGEVAPDNRWTHVAVTRTGTHVTFYVDARRLATSTQEGAFLRSGGTLQIGHDGAERNGGMLGWISSVALYARGLEDEEIADLMSSMD